MHFEPEEPSHRRTPARGQVLEHPVAAGREAGPTAGVIDSRLVKTTESGGRRGYDAGVVERTFARPGRCRRLEKDVEATIKSAVAWITIASIRLMTKRLARA